MSTQTKPAQQGSAEQRDGRLSAQIQQRRPFASKAEEAFLNLLRTTSLLSTELSRRLKAYELSPALYNLLRILRGAHPERLTCSDISDRLVSPGQDVDPPAGSSRTPGSRGPLARSVGSAPGPSRHLRYRVGAALGAGSAGRTSGCARFWGISVRSASSCWWGCSKRPASTWKSDRPTAGSPAQSLNLASMKDSSRSAASSLRTRARTCSTVP